MGEFANIVKSLNKEELASLREKSPKDYSHLMMEAHRERGREDFWYFLTKVIKNPVLHPPLHKPIARWLEPKGWTTTKKLLLMSRGHVKSNLITIGWSAWNIVKNPNVRILIVSHKSPDAMKFCRATRILLDSDEFQAVYPEIGPAYPNKTKSGRQIKWGDQAFRVERTRNLVENTVETGSSRHVVTGRHYDIIIYDDLVVRESVAQPVLIEGTKEYHQHCDSLLDPGGLEVMTGTHYDYMDEYARIRNTPLVAKDYDIKVIPELTVVGKHHKGAVYVPWEKEWCIPNYPTRFTLADDDEGDPEKGGKISLPKKRRTQGAYVYNTQYRLDPLDPSTRIFKVIPEIPELPQDGRGYRYGQVCDLSQEGNTDSATAIVSFAWDKEGNIFITDVFYGQYPVSRIVDELFRAQQQDAATRPQFVGFEPAPYERAVQQALEREAEERGIFVPIVYLDGNQAQKAKDERIRGLEPWVTAGKFFVLTTCRDGQQAINELYGFPRTRAKDVADAMAQIPHHAWTPKERNDLAKATTPFAVKKGDLYEMYNRPDPMDDMFDKPNVIGARHVMRSGVSASVRVGRAW